MTDLIDPIVQTAEFAPAPAPEFAPVVARDQPPPPVVERPKYVQVGAPRTFNPDALLEAGVFRASAAGAAVGFIMFTVCVGLVGKWVGMTDSASLFVGMFTGFWGGLGFGAMVGMARTLIRDEKERAAATGPRTESP